MFMDTLKKIKWKKVGNLLFLMVIFLATLWSVFRGEDIHQMFSSLGKVSKAFLIPSLLCVLLFILGESVVIFLLMSSLKTKISFSHCCLYSFIGFFYSCITPSASGGQPMQVIAMHKDRIPVAVSSVVLAIVTITYKMVLVLLGTAVLLFRPPSIMHYLKPVEELVLLGIFLNIACIAALLLLVFDPNAVHRIGKGFFSLMNHFHWLKHPEKQEQRLNRIIQQYQGTANFYRSNKSLIFRVFFITLLQRCCLFLITWLVYRSFGLSGHSLPLILTLQGMISVAADMLPLPGGMGVSENIFLKIFYPIFGEAFLLPGMVLSRGISYYTQLIISAIMTVFASFVIKEKLQ